MTREEIIQVCDLYAQGINELSKLTSQQGYSEELNEMLISMLKNEGHSYACDWLKRYVLSNSQINDNGKELLYVAQKTAKRTRKEVISKACEWLMSELYHSEDRYGYPNVESRSYVSVEDFIKDFKKAMEE